MTQLLSLCALLFVALLMPPVSAQSQGGGGGDSTGSLPVTYTRNPGDCGGGAEKAGPGDAAISNADGVSCSVGASGKGSVRLDPKDGGADCSSTASTKSGTMGASISGLDANDTARIGASTKATTVSGDGGTVHLASGCTVTVTNPPAPSAPVNVILPGGQTVNIPDGSSVTFNT